MTACESCDCWDCWFVARCVGLWQDRRDPTTARSLTRSRWFRRQTRPPGLCRSTTCITREVCLVPPGRLTGSKSYSPLTSPVVRISGRCALQGDGRSNLPSLMIGSTAPRGRPTANGSSTSRTTRATSFGTYSPYRPTVARRSTSPTRPPFANRVRTGPTTAKLLLSPTRPRTALSTISPCSTGALAKFIS